MRMWRVDPQLMCRQHLLGEHVELHIMVGTLRAGKRMDGYYTKGLVDVRLILGRHGQLVREMEARGMAHRSSLPPFPDVRAGAVDAAASAVELARRCPACRSLGAAEAGAAAPEAAVRGMPAGLARRG